MSAIELFLTAIKQYAQLNDIAELITLVNCQNENISLFYLKYKEMPKDQPNNPDCGAQYTEICNKFKEAVFLEIKNTTYDFLERGKVVIVNGLYTIEIKHPPKVGLGF